MEKKVFGYPEFSAEGEQILCTYENEYRDMLMDIRVYRMKKGEERSFSKEKEEFAVLLLSGKIKFVYEGTEKEGSRKDVFTEGPYAVHLSKGKEVLIRALEDSESVRKMKRIFPQSFMSQRMRHGFTPAQRESLAM